MKACEVVISGVCRVCGCTEAAPCIDMEGDFRCAWVDAEHTLCDKLTCIAQVPLEVLELMLAVN